MKEVKTAKGRVKSDFSETIEYGVGWRHSEQDERTDPNNKAKGADYDTGSKLDGYVDQAPDILVCQIKIWNPDNETNLQPAPKKERCLMVLHEVENITVNDSYKNVISTATVTIPKGSIIKKVVTNVSVNQNTEAQDDQVATERQSDTTKASVKNDVSSDANDLDGTKLFTEDSVSKTGIVLTTRTEKGSPVEPSMFRTGYRIEIRCGYTQDPKVAEKIDEYEDHKCLNLVFSGFITGISPTTPIELRCEDLAYILRTVDCDDVPSKGNRKVKEFLCTKAEGGEYGWLEGTDIELHEDTKSMDIDVGAVDVSHHITVADMLNEWSKSGLVSFMRLCSDGKYRLSVGRTYISTQATESKDSIMYHPDEGIVMVYSDWDVAEDGLSIMNVDKNFIIIDAQGWKVEDGRNYHCKFSIRLNPESKEGDPDDKRFQFINEKDWTSTRKGKRKKGSKRTPIMNKVRDLKAYSRYPYISKNWGVTKEKLKEEAIAYFKSFNPSGVSGKLTLFGGRDIRPTSIIGFVDMRQPARQGYYLVEEVDTKFGVGGYRQEITIPYRIKLFDNVKIAK